MTDQSSGRAKRGGRKGRLAHRAAGPAVHPCPPGQVGGQYKPLAVKEIEAIFVTACKLLAELGMGEVPDRLMRDLVAAGATEDGAGRALIPEALVRKAIELAPKTFPLHGRDSARTITVGGDRVYFGTGGAAVQTLDLDTGVYRPATDRKSVV